jgi:hypothetical protein
MSNETQIQVRANQEANQIDIFDAEKMANLKTFAEGIVASSLFPQVTKAEDAITAIVIGNEIGLSPMVAIANAKKLVGSKIHSIIRGREMGLPAGLAMDNIHQIPTKNGAVTATGVHIITAMLIRAGVKMSFIEDSTPLYKYMEISTKQMLDKELVEGNPMVYQIVHAGTKKDQRDMSKSQVILNTNPYTYRTTIKFSRESTGQEITISYSLQDATDAGLYPGTSTVTGQAVQGKQNWIENWKTMLRNRVMSIGGRIIASDKLGGVYEFSEITDGIHTMDTEVIEQATVLKDTKGNVIAGDESAKVDEIVNAMENTSKGSYGEVTIAD